MQGKTVTHILVWTPHDWLRNNCKIQLTISKFKSKQPHKIEQTAESVVECEGGQSDLASYCTYELLILLLFLDL